jgi:hypothetical protein
VPEPPPKEWTTPTPAPAPEAAVDGTAQDQRTQEALHQQYAPGWVPAHAPGAEQILVYALQVAAEQAKLMGVVKNLADTVKGAAWCNSDGAGRMDEWRKTNSEAVMRSGEAIGFLVGRAMS